MDFGFLYWFVVLVVFLVGLIIGFLLERRRSTRFLTGILTKESWRLVRNFFGRDFNEFYKYVEIVGSSYGVSSRYHQSFYLYLIRKIMEPSVFLAAISATLQAIQTWKQFRDNKRASSSFQESYSAKLEDRDILDEVRLLTDLIPANVLDRMIQRTRECWLKYQEVLDGDYLPGEIDEATEAVQRCICRELQRIYKLNGSIPQGELSRWWNQYCRIN